MNKKLLAGAIAGGLLMGGNAFASNYESTYAEVLEICQGAHELAAIVVEGTSFDGASITDNTTAADIIYSKRDSGVALFSITNIESNVMTLTPSSNAALGVLSSLTVTFTVANDAATSYVISNSLSNTGADILPGFEPDNAAMNSTLQNVLDDNHCGESMSGAFSNS